MLVLMMIDSSMIVTLLHVFRTKGPEQHEGSELYLVNIQEKKAC